MECPLCKKATQLSGIESSDGKSYHLCGSCYLVFADRRCLPSAEEELAHYRNHENGIQHQGYLSFLNRAIQPARPFLKSGMLGLDYGCGSAPTLSLLLREEGYAVDNYDPYFFPDLDEHKRYDFIFATECFEHFFYPAKDLLRLRELLKPNSLLIVMTEFRKEMKDFKQWYYVRDPTHVAFYHQQTFREISRLFGFHVLFTDGSRVIILQKQ